MAQRSSGEVKVEEGHGGVDSAANRVDPDRPAREIVADLMHEPDRELHPKGEPKREADKTSAPSALDAELRDPPLRSPHPMDKLIRSLATGAGRHVPPDPDEYDAEGRIKYDRVAAGNQHD